MYLKKFWNGIKAKRISLLWLCIIFGCISFGAITYIKYLPVKPLLVYKADTNNIFLNDMRQQSGILTRPLLLVDINQESEQLAPLKQKINTYIEQQKQSGKINDASVYIRDLGRTQWFSINPGTEYSPGSIAKLFVMIACLKQTEQSPDFLKKTILFTAHVPGIPEHTVTGPALQLGSTYSVKDLLQYLIVYSDNDASNLLIQNVSFPLFQKVFTDLSLPMPRQGQLEYQFTVEECARLMRLLYNASYLNQQMSEFALSLLAQATYNDGLTKDIDKSVTVAHKFGEHSFGNWKELHETAIVYLNNNPYLITVMTKGIDYNALHFILNDISDMVYTDMKSRNS